MLLPLGTGVAAAAAGFPAVQAGGPRHGEKPLLRNPRLPRIKVIIRNDNESRNYGKRHGHHHDKVDDHGVDKTPEPVEDDYDKDEYDRDEYDRGGYDRDYDRDYGHNRNPWWWPGGWN
ncbi:hypothetical protein [Nonomuraea sp. NPDC050783]|uniref:hypothetical protein n=1 Tax=Nonomuraea sp. NPDC050783 TaxID=3154634 RepID=UPI003465C5FF